MPRVFPAPAGINRIGDDGIPGLLRVPRASGDKPAQRLLWCLARECSPRQRG
ncbi:hypothetical protein HMPREF9534_05352 [Escherichia coli MS 69-1]|nr:hypothetical protein HMPREF9534_05352 [Escherichia coli MS 69-1]ESD80425.1 hypothetical protein HMPREF1611_04104 [Escherichia coli 908573]